MNTNPPQFPRPLTCSREIDNIRADARFPGLVRGEPAFTVPVAVLKLVQPRTYGLVGDVDGDPVSLGSTRRYR